MAIQTEDELANGLRAGGVRVGGALRVAAKFAEGAQGARGLELLPRWADDYNRIAAHLALSMSSPAPVPRRNCPVR